MKEVIIMERYSKILDKDKREIVLLIGNGCKWSKCKFCNYHLDRNNIKLIVRLWRM